MERSVTSLRVTHDTGWGNATGLRSTVQTWRHDTGEATRRGYDTLVWTGLKGLSYWCKINIQRQCSGDLGTEVKQNFFSCVYISSEMAAVNCICSLFLKYRELYRIFLDNFKNLIQKIFVTFTITGNVYFYLPEFTSFYSARRHIS